MRVIYSACVLLQAELPTFLVSLFTLFSDGVQQQHCKHWLGQHGQQLQATHPRVHMQSIAAAKM